MNRFDWKETIKLNIVCLKIVGLWPEKDKTYGKNVYTIYAICSIIFQISHISFEIINLFMIIDDLEAVTGSGFILIVEILTIIKAYCLIKNMGKLKKLMKIVDSDLFQPKNQHQRDMIQPNIKAWRMNVAALRLLAFGWFFFWCSVPLFDKTYKKYRLPFLAWYPYSTRSSPRYELTYLYQVAAISFLVMTNIHTDALIAALNMFIGAQFDILCDNLKNLHSDGTDNSKQKLENCIHHHKKILKFADYANQFYNWLIFIEFIVAGIAIGLSMFQLTVVVPFSSEFFSFLSYSNGISVEVFMYCWFGNEIELKSSKLAYAVFESDWTELSSEMKHNLIIFILRIQKSFKISALGLFNLSLDTYMKIMRTAWSYFALLRQVNARKY